jgi:hypothetical protein
MTVDDALRLHYAASGLPPDGGRAARQWTLKLGPLRLHLGNFAWRRQALPRHDVHHLVTGYACTPAGEFEMAAWEFAAGRFPDPFATLFCLPLVGIGAIATPRRSFAAFVRGRRSRTLYAAPLTPDLLRLSVRQLRDRLLPHNEPTATADDLVRYLALATLSCGLATAPVLFLLLLNRA